MKQRVKNALRIILLIICGMALGINVYLANANKLVGNQMPMPFGYGMATVLSGSMEPELSKGDLLIVFEADEYDVDDIVVFQDGRSLVVHRIVGWEEGRIVTKGDANNVPDQPIEPSNIKGKVTYWVPYAGSVVEMIKTPIGTICLLGAAIALLEIPRRREKKKDEEEQRKILEEIENLKKELYRK